MKFIKWLTLSLLVVLIAGVAVSQQKNQKRKGRAVLSVPKVAKKDLICFALYTVHDNTLKLTAQLYPLAAGDSRTVGLEIKKEEEWVEVARATVIERGWTAPFRVEQWNDSQAYEYRVVHGAGSTYTGTIRKNPVDKGEIVMAAFTGNSIHPAHGGDISREDIIANVKRIDADVLFFAGDQVYDHFKHFAGWLKFGRDFGEIIKDRPTLCLPDD
ncbi:MAG TPA: hypothetical protein DIV39_08665, partial [Verrucomicrobiales bacterium]|nr:hypothetical protein [Verrucomicrobiales bacterium]